MKLITLVQENNLDGRPERHVAHVYALACVTLVADRTAPASRHGLVALIEIVLVVVVVGAQHPWRYVLTLSQ